MTQTRNIKDADPRLQKVWAYVLANFAKKHPDFPKFILSEVYRSPDVQRALYAQGREKIAIVNKLRMAVGLAAISETENRRKVTNAKPGQSEHQEYPSKAIDILFIIPYTKQISNDIKLYRAMAEMIRGQDPSITWGGDWDKDWRSDDEKLLDLAHFQVP